MLFRSAIIFAQVYPNAGHPLTGPCQQSMPHPGDVSRHCFSFGRLPSSILAPVSSIVAANESRQTPIWIKQLAALRHRPDGEAVPEERWCRFVSNWLITFVVVAVVTAPILGWLTLQAIRFVTQTVTANNVQFIRNGFASILHSGSSSPSKLRRNSVLHQTVFPPS